MIKLIIYGKKKDFIDFLKIDAEGSELDILNGALKTKKEKDFQRLNQSF